MLDITLRSLSLLVYLFLISYFFLIGQQLLKVIENFIMSSGLL